MHKLVGIPGTVSDAVRRANWQRLADRPAVPGVMGTCRVYEAHVEDGTLRALVSQDQDPAGPVGKLLWHVSVSHRDKQDRPDRCPSWDELKHAAYRLVQADVPLVLILPRRTRPYVDLHPTTLHLWQGNEEIDS
jgi:hypothetical protein